MQLDHDYSSPSKLNLRYFCPGSVRLERNLIGTGVSTTSEPAAKGTIKHDQVKQYRDKADIPPNLPDDVAWVIDKVVEQTMQYCTSPEAIVLDEYQVDLSNLGISGGREGCRIDLGIIIPGRKAVIIDYKFGVMYVPRPKYNWQMKAYAIGVFRAFGVTEIEVIILQPNTEEKYQVKTDFFYAPEISEFETQIKEIVARTKVDDAPLVRGDHCSYDFCRAKDICPLWRNAYLQLPIHMTVAAHLKNIAPEQRKQLYENVIAAESWCKKARAIVELLAVNNEIDVAGYEVGPGRKTRTWGKLDSELEAPLHELMRALGKPMALYAIKTPAEIEASLGKSKKVQEALKPLIIYTEGKPTLKKKNETE